MQNLPGARTTGSRGRGDGVERGVAPPDRLRLPRRRALRPRRRRDGHAARLPPPPGPRRIPCARDRAPGPDRPRRRQRGGARGRRGRSSQHAGHHDPGASSSVGLGAGGGAQIALQADPATSTLEAYLAGAVGADARARPLARPGRFRGPGLRSRTGLPALALRGPRIPTRTLGRSRSTKRPE